MKKSLALLGLVLLLVAATPVFADTTINYEVTIEEPTIGLTVTNDTSLSGTVARDDDQTFWVGFVNTFRNTGNVIGTLSAKLDSVPAGLGNAVLGTPATAGDFKMSSVEVDPDTHLTIGTETDFDLTSTEVNQIYAADSVSMLTKITFAPNTPAGSYTFPVTWTLTAN